MGINPLTPSNLNRYSKATCSASDAVTPTPEGIKETADTQNVFIFPFDLRERDLQTDK